MNARVKPQERIRELERKVIELSAQMAHRPYFACQELLKTGRDRMAGSAVILTIHALGGRELVEPVAIRGGLSDEAINALQSDLCASFDDATAFKPKARAAKATGSIA